LAGDPVPIAIETRGLCREFGGRPAVRDLELRIRRGELYGFLGPNGAGKTTTIRMLGGLLRPTRGEIRIDGHDARDGAAHVRRITGLVPDTPPLQDYLTGRQYVAFVASLWRVPATQRDEEAERLFRLFDLADRADDLCKGYSHGMRKKLHVAAVLATRPKVLLLDEPTAGLDPRSARILKDLLRETSARGVTVFLSTHLLETAQEICDRIGILSQGERVAEGTMEELRSREDESLERIFLRLTEEADAGAPPG